MVFFNPSICVGRSFPSILPPLSPPPPSPRVSLFLHRVSSDSRPSASPLILHYNRNENNKKDHLSEPSVVRCFFFLSFFRPSSSPLFSLSLYLFLSLPVVSPYYFIHILNRNHIPVPDERLAPSLMEIAKCSLDATIARIVITY